MKKLMFLTLIGAMVALTSTAKSIEPKPKIDHSEVVMPLSCVEITGGDLVTPFEIATILFPELIIAVPVVHVENFAGKCVERPFAVDYRPPSSMARICSWYGNNNSKLLHLSSRLKPLYKRQVFLC